MSTNASAETLEMLLRQSATLQAVFDRWAALNLPDAWLVAGAVAQTVWNLGHGRRPTADIKDLDIVYFDAGDLGAGAEAAHERRIAGLFRDLAIKVDVKNEARVHLWYGRVFGRTIAPYTSTAAAIATFPATATSLGVRPAGSKLDMEAPFGPEDLLGMVVRPNRTLVSREVYEAKASRWRIIWPGLKVHAWENNKTLYKCTSRNNSPSNVIKIFDE